MIAFREAPPQRIVVWGVELSRLSAADLARYAAVLDDEERGRAAALSPEGGRAHVAAHGTKRLLLSNLGGLPPRAWRFRRSRAGKPSLEPDQNRSGLCFSLSHSRGYVAVAAAIDCAVGLDVETTGRTVDPLAFANAYFTRSEVAELRGMTPSAARAHFFELWTTKEAVLKALGEGLRRGPRALDVPALRAGGSWALATWHPTPGHVATVAVRSPAELSVAPGW